MRVQSQHALSLLIKMSRKGHLGILDIEKSYCYDVWVFIKSCIIVVFTYVSHLFCALQKRDKLLVCNL